MTVRVSRVFRVRVWGFRGLGVSETRARDRGPMGAWAKILDIKHKTRIQ